MHRWEALVRFDPEIRAAAEKLAPYGMEWVEELGLAFFALNEDRAYLPNILLQLLEDAAREAHLRAEVERLHASRVRAELYARTENGEVCSNRSMRILEAAEAAGYILSRKENGTIVVSLGQSTTFLYSNTDIERFSRILAQRGQFEVE